jgi:hypothetical protein
MQMKKIFSALSLLMLLTSCGDGITGDTMILSGTVKGLKKGTLYLQHVPDSVLVVVDSLNVDGDGSFSFQIELEEPDIFYLYLNKKDNNEINDRISFFAEPGTITIHTSWNTFDASPVIKGSTINDKFEEYQRTMTHFNKKNLEYMNASVNSEQPLNTAELDSLQRLSDKNTQKSYAFALNFALNNLDSPLAPYLAVNQVPDANVKYLDSIYNALLPDVAASKYGQRLKHHLESINKKEP